MPPGGWRGSTLAALQVGWALGVQNSRPKRTYYYIIITIYSGERWKEKKKNTYDTSTKQKEPEIVSK